MRCVRCGWDMSPVVVHPPDMSEWPSDYPAPPPFPVCTNPHPVGECPCPVALGEIVYWDLGGQAPDLPPIRGEFLRIESFDGPEYELCDGVWDQIAEPLALAEIKLDETSVHPRLLEEFPHLIKKNVLTVIAADLTPVSKWPIIIPKE